MSNINPLTFEVDGGKAEYLGEVRHKKWNVIVAFYVNTLDYNPKANPYSDKGLELMHTDVISLCADANTEMYFQEIAVEDISGDFADECCLDKTEPGCYKCVCGIGINDIVSQTQEGTEYDTELYYYLLSRTKLSKSDVDFIIDEHHIYPTDEEYAEIVSNQA